MDGGEQLGRQPWVLGPQKKMKFGWIFLRIHVLDATCLHYNHCNFNRQQPSASVTQYIKVVQNITLIYYKNVICCRIVVSTQNIIRHAIWIYSKVNCYNSSHKKL